MDIKLDYSQVRFQENGRLKLLIIVGTRPEIIRLAAVINKCRSYFDCLLAHTGQNYDYNLNGVFFRDLKLKAPDVYMDAVGDDLGATMGNIIDASYKLVVQVTECRDPVAIKQDGTVYLLCNKGNIVDTVSAAKWSQYIQIEGLTLLDPQVGGEARASATQQMVLERLLEILTLLVEKGMLHQVQVIDLSDASHITMRYMSRFDVQFLWDADFDYKLDYLAAVVDRLEDNEKGSIDMTQEGKASFIPG